MTLLITVNIKYRCNITFINVISKVNKSEVIYKYGRGVLIFFEIKKNPSTLKHITNAFWTIFRSFVE